MPYKKMIKKCSLIGALCCYQLIHTAEAKKAIVSEKITDGEQELSRYTPLSQALIKIIKAYIGDARYQQYITWNAHRGYIPTAFLTGDLVISSANDESTRIWNKDSGIMLGKLRGQITDKSGPSALSPDGKHLVITDYAGKIARVFDMAHVNNKEIKQPLHTLRGHSDSVTLAALGPDGKIVTGSEDGTAHVYAENGTFLHALGYYTGFVRDAKFSPDGKHLFTAGAHHAIGHLFNTSTGKLIHTFNKLETPITTAAFSTDSQRIALASGNVAKLHDVETGACVWTSSPHPYPVESVLFSHDNKHVITTSNDTAYMVCATTGALSRTFQGHSKRINYATLHDQLLLTASNDNSVRTWDTQTEKCLSILPHGARVTAVHCSPDGRCIVTATDKGSIHIWNKSPFSKHYTAKASSQK